MIINENELIRYVSRKHNIKDTSLLEKLWKESETEQINNGTVKDMASSVFWNGDGKKNKGVIKYFKEKINQLDIEEAKMTVDTKENFDKSANEFIDAIVKDDYKSASDAFPSVVKNKLINIVDNKKEIYLKSLQQKATNIVKDET